MSATDAGRRTRDFLARTIDRFEELRGEGARDMHWRIGPWHVCQKHLGPELVGPLTGAFAHHREPAGSKPDLTVYCLDATRPGLDLGTSPWTAADIGSIGAIRGLEATGLRAVWDYRHRAFHLFDAERAVALACFPGRDGVADWDRSCPLRPVLHWHAMRSGQVLVHAGAVGTGEGGALLVGPGGAGKSTTALACLEAGLSVAGDDFVMVEEREAPHVHSLYCRAKLDDRGMGRLAAIRSAPLPVEPDAIGEKNMIPLDRAGSEATIAGFPLKMMLKLERTGEPESEIVPATPGEILAASAPNTLAILPGEHALLLGRLARLSRSAPCFTFRLGTDLTRAGRCLRNVLEAA